MAPDRVAKTVAALVDPVPAKHVTLVRNGAPESLETHAATAGDLLADHGIALAPDDALNVAPASSLVDGETVVYRAALPVSVTVDGKTRFLRSPALSVAALLARTHVTWDRHDEVSPPPATPLASDLTIVVRHVQQWTEHVRRPVSPAVVKRWALTVPTGRTQIVDPGQPGLAEVSYRFQRTPDRRGVHRTELATRILRPAHDRIVVEGIGEYTALSELARREMIGTLKLATSALNVIATAYTAHCGGCSGTTATGSAAGHGIVAVDPAVIPLGTKLFIPGYGKAVAGDTGGAIRGRRIDLGFNSRSQATQFGRRAVVVYLFK